MAWETFQKSHQDLGAYFSDKKQKKREGINSIGVRDLIAFVPHSLKQE